MMRWAGLSSDNSSYKDVFLDLLRNLGRLALVLLLMWVGAQIQRRAGAKEIKRQLEASRIQLDSLQAQVMNWAPILDLPGCIKTWEHPTADLEGVIIMNVCKKEVYEDFFGTTRLPNDNQVGGEDVQVPGGSPQERNAR